MRYRVFIDAAGLDDRTVVLRARWHDAIGFAFNSARSDAEARRRAVEGGRLLLARLRSQRRLRQQAGMVMLFRRL